MSVYLTFLTKEWHEVKQSKKLLLFLSISLLLPLVSNYLAKSPLISMEILAPFYVVISACVVAEFIKASLIEEFTSSTLDSILIAPFKKDFLIFYKTTIPILITFTITILGLILSDGFAVFIPSFSYFVKMTTFINILTAFMASCVCAWICFYLILKTRKITSTFHTLTLVAIASVMGLVAIASHLYSFAILILFGFSLLFFVYVICKIMLISPQPLKKSTTYQWFCFFRGQNLNFISAIIVKDLATIQTSHLAEILLYVAMFFVVKIPILFYGLVFLLTTFGARKLLYQNIIEEKINKTGDILQIQKSNCYIFLVRAIVPTLVSLVSSLISILISAPTVANIGFALLIVFLSPIFVYPISKVVNRPKEISVGGVLASTVLLFFYLLTFFIIFLW